MSGLRVRSGLHDGARPPFTPWQATAHVVRFAPASRWPWALFVGFWALVSHWWLG